MSTGLDITIPKSWSWSPLKFTTTFLNRGSAPDYVDEGPVRAISQAANQLTGLDWTRTRFSAYDGDPRRLKGYLLNGDTLINSTGNGTLGRVGYFIEGPDDIPCVADGHVTLVRADRRVVEPRYLYYWLSSTLFYNFIYSALVVGATNQIELNREGLAGAPIALPPLGEQRRVTDYLDRETVRIDALVTAKKRMAESLEEQLTSYREDLLIRSQVVRWIPLHRLTDPLRPIVYGIVQAGPEFPGGIPYIKTGDLPQLDPSTLSRTSPEIDEAYRRARVIPGDIVVAMRASIGTAVRVPSTLPTANLTQGTARIAPGKGIDGRWLLHVFRTRAVQEQCSVRAVGTTFKTLNIWDLRRVLIPQPDLNNCSVLADQMDEYVEKYERMAATLKRQVDLLHERRQGLITAAVTGQLDISGAA